MDNKLSNIIFIDFGHVVTQDLCILSSSSFVCLLYTWRGTSVELNACSPILVDCFVTGFMINVQKIIKKLADAVTFKDAI